MDKFFHILFKSVTLAMKDRGGGRIDTLKSMRNCTPMSLDHLPQLSLVNISTRQPYCVHIPCLINVFYFVLWAGMPIG